MFEMHVISSSVTPERLHLALNLRDRRLTGAHPETI
jgi:hypothetical protein